MKTCLILLLLLLICGCARRPGLPAARLPGALLLFAAKVLVSPPSRPTFRSEI